MSSSNAAPDELSSVYGRTLKEHAKLWKNCTKCPLGKVANAKCFFDSLSAVPPGGRIDVLFVGEGPGRSENVIGRPFSGPTGRFLRETVNSVNDIDVKVGFSNLVACRPADTPRSEDRPPTEEEAKACSSRLKELIEIVNPVMVVTVGRVPAFYIHLSGWRGPLERIVHPSAIQRGGGTKSRDFVRWREEIRRVLTLSTSFKSNHEERTTRSRFRPAR